MRMLVGHKPCHKRMQKRTVLMRSLEVAPIPQPTLLPPEDQEVASDEEDVKESGPVESRDCRLRAGRLEYQRTQYMQYAKSLLHWNAAALILLGDVAKDPVQKNGQIQVPQPRGWFHATRATVAQHQGWWGVGMWAVFEMQYLGHDRKPRLQKYSIPKTHSFGDKRIE